MAKSSMGKVEVVDHANDIRTSYERQGLKLTLRQMYYQFVSRGLIANSQNEYKRLGSILTDARYDGDFPIDGLEDRGREVHFGDYTAELADLDQAMANAKIALNNIPRWYVNAAKWLGQPYHVSVWVEKEALAGVFQPVCEALGVGWFACKGYPSVSALDQWYTAAIEAHNMADVDGDSPWEPRESLVLYFGDHDPDGWEIPRSAERNLAKIGRLHGEDLPITFKRVALNMDQIQTYNPPPFPAKPSSARYDGYVQEHDTEDAWELDALDPATLQRLIRAEVNAVFDASILRTVQERVGERRAEVVEAMSDPEWAASILGRV